MTLDEFSALCRCTAHYDIELPIDDFDSVVDKLGCRLHKDRQGRTFFEIWQGGLKASKHVYRRAPLVSLGW